MILLSYVRSSKAKKISKRLEDENELNGYPYSLVLLYEAMSLLPFAM